jgi:hypothetical protein
VGGAWEGSLGGSLVGRKSKDCRGEVKITAGRAAERHGTGAAWQGR